MQIILIIISLIGICYFLLAKRIFDFFSLSFFSAILYAMPGFFGYVLVASPIPKSDEMLKTDIVDETYAVMALVIAFITIGAIFFDYCISPKDFPLVSSNPRGMISAILLLTIIGFLFSIVSWIAAGSPTLTGAHKTEVFSTLGRFYILWQLGTTLLAAISFSCRKWVLFGVAISLMLSDLFVGNRETVVFSVLSVVSIWLLSQGRQRLIKFWKQIFIFLPFALIPILYKGIYRALQAGNWDLVYSRLSNPAYYLDSLIFSEPFRTQGILNQIIITRFKTGTEPLQSLFPHLILFSKQLGFETVDFNSIYQPVLFGFKEAGLASNVWAEMWSMGGWPLLIIFAILYTSVILYSSYIITVKKNSKNAILRAFVIVLMVVWTFFLNRAGLLYTVNILKRILVIFIICKLATIVIPFKVKRCI